jgi:uncharacterized membrane protein YeaQ/YmgE (transglycosylase-associated protein family)
MDITNLLIWIIVGAIAGWLASIVMKTNSSQGLLSDIIPAQCIGCRRGCVWH